jgi:hypothetical protein
VGELQSNDLLGTIVPGGKRTKQWNVESGSLDSNENVGSPLISSPLAGPAVIRVRGPQWPPSAAISAALSARSQIPASSSAPLSGLKTVSPTGAAPSASHASGVAIPSWPRLSLPTGTPSR